MNRKDYRVTFTGRMKAELVECEMNLTPLPGEIAGENIVSLVSTGSERGGFTQQFPPESYPMQTGSSSIGRVIAVGEGVKDFREGDLFYHNEHHTRFVKLSSGDAIHVPEGADPERVVFGRYCAVPMTSIYKMQARPSDQIIVSGQGLVGTMAAAVLQCFGYTVYATDPSQERREMSREAGIAYVGESLKALGVSEKSCGAQIECSGVETAIREAIPYLRQGGEIFQVGVPWKQYSDWSARDLLYDLFYGFISIHGGWEWSIPKKEDAFHHHSSYSHIEMAMQLIVDGKIRIPDSFYELRDPRKCDDVYQEIAHPAMRPTSMMFDWRTFCE